MPGLDLTGLEAGRFLELLPVTSVPNLQFALLQILASCIHCRLLPGFRPGHAWICLAFQLYAPNGCALVAFILFFEGPGGIHVGRLGVPSFSQQTDRTLRSATVNRKPPASCGVALVSFSGFQRIPRERIDHPFGHRSRALRVSAAPSLEQIPSHRG